MAISLLRRAADAIVARSELAQNVRSLETESTYLKTQVDRLSNERNNMDETIRYLTAQLTEAKRKVDELEANNNRHVDRIGVLEATVLDQSNILNEIRAERDNAQFDLLEEREAHAATKASLADANTKLDAIRNVFPVPAPVAVPEVAAVSTFPADTQQSAGADFSVSSDNLPPRDVSMERPGPSAFEPWRSSHAESTSPSRPAAETEAGQPAGSSASPSPSPVADEPRQSDPWGFNNPSDDDLIF